jgi:hypothetical protein
LIFDDNLRLNTLRYLTHEMTVDERALFNERLLYDHEFSDAVALCEQDLIDTYACGTMNAEEKGIVQLWIKASPRRMERVEFARALLKKRPKVVSVKPYIGVVLAVAACLLVALGLIFRTIRESRYRGLKTVASSTAVHLARSANPAIVEKDNSQKEQTILVIAERTRGKQKITTYSVHLDAPLRLQVLLIGEIAPTGYTLKITSLKKNQPFVLERTGLSAESVKEQLYLSLLLPPGSLPADRYIVRVSVHGRTLVSQFVVR